MRKTINTFIQNTSNMPWKCPVCGYENPDDANFCVRCGAQKPAQLTAENMQQQVATQQPQQEQVTAQQQTLATTPAEQQQVQSLPVAQQPAPAQQQLPEQQAAQNPPQAPQASVQQAAAQTSQAQQAQLQRKYYLLFIQTPYTNLINQKVPLNFDIFPAISIGRSPENVIIVPDPEVSRRHAVVSLEGGELYIEDLNSTNGTYVYDGKLFQPIKGKQKVAPNSIIKLGNQTIVKLIAE